MLKQLRALWTLGTAFLVKVLTWPFAGKQSGRRWLSRLEQEALRPTAAGAWSRFEPASRCIGCGLCDAAVSQSGELASPSILSAPRMPGDAPLVRDRVATLREQAAAIARVCPTRVGVEEIATIIEDNAKNLEAPL